MHEAKRVVITGIGVVASNGVGIPSFHQALKEGRSGISSLPEMKAVGLRCQIGGKPKVSESYKEQFLPELLAAKLKNNAVVYGVLAGLEAWKNAGLSYSGNDIDENSGIIFGSGALGLDSSTSEKMHNIEAGLSRKMGSFTIPETMSSGSGAFLNNILGLGNRIQANSSACITGSEALLLGYEHIVAGKAKRMLCGSTEGEGIYIWGSFDALRVLCADSNNNPEGGSRPMSDSLGGFVPSSGSGALLLESLESAKQRNATILAEVKGGFINSGGQRNGGSLTAPNLEAVKKCIKAALHCSETNPEHIDLISGHLTGTPNDISEINCWYEALGLTKDEFPMINAPKSMIGHAIGAVGSIELVACVLQLHNSFIHPSINCEKIHPEILKIISAEKIPQKSIEQEINTVIKANFGFGDQNCCVVLQKWKG